MSETIDAAETARLAAIAGPARLWATGYVPHTNQDHARAHIMIMWPELAAAFEAAIAAMPPICWRCGEDIAPLLTFDNPPDGRPSHGTCPRDLP